MQYAVHFARRTIGRLLPIAAALWIVPVGVAGPPADPAADARPAPTGRLADSLLAESLLRERLEQRLKTVAGKDQERFAAVCRAVASAIDAALGDPNLDKLADTNDFVAGMTDAVKNAMLEALAGAPRDVQLAWPAAYDDMLDRLREDPFWKGKFDPRDVKSWKQAYRIGRDVLARAAESGSPAAAIRSSPAFQQADAADRVAKRLFELRVDIDHRFQPTCEKLADVLEKVLASEAAARDAKTLVAEASRAALDVLTDGQNVRGQIARETWIKAYQDFFAHVETAESQGRFPVDDVQQWQTAIRAVVAGLRKAVELDRENIARLLAEETIARHQAETDSAGGRHRRRWRLRIVDVDRVPRSATWRGR